MNAPRVSVCLPNLNNRAYLEERIATIEAQSFKDWELVICDNFSDDGAWEFFQELAKRDSRVRISQEPRAGMYANWNNCIVKARGEFIYVATSDDTMAEDCLEKMVKALDAIDAVAVTQGPGLIGSEVLKRCQCFFTLHQP